MMPLRITAVLLVAMLGSACGDADDAGDAAAPETSTTTTATTAPPTTEPPPTTALPSTAPPTTATPSTAPPSTAPPTTAPPSPPGRAAVEISQFYFKPSPLTVTAPTTVTWTNRDNILHTATSGTPESPDKRFDGPMDGAGASFEFTFTRPGSYKYFCSRHKSMVGEVVVN